MKKKIKKNLAFTLIEILVVATIIGVLVTVTAVSFASSHKRSRDARRKADLETVRQALVLYRQDQGSYGDVGLDSEGFISTVDILAAGNYLTSTSVVDPKSGNPRYSISCIEGSNPNCNRVSLTASLETDTSPYVVITP